MLPHVRWIIALLLLGVLSRVGRWASTRVHREPSTACDCIVLLLKHETRVETLKQFVTHAMNVSYAPSRVYFLVSDMCLPSLQRFKRHLLLDVDRSMPYTLVLKADTRLPRHWDRACVAQMEEQTRESVLSTLPKDAPRVTFTCLLHASKRVGSRYAHSPAHASIPNLFASLSFLFARTRTFERIQHSTGDMALTASIRHADVRIVVPNARVYRLRDAVERDDWHHTERRAMVESFLVDIGASDTTIGLHLVLGLTKRPSVEEMVFKYGSVEEVVAQTNRKKCDPVVAIARSSVPTTA